MKQGTHKGKKKISKRKENRIDRTQSYGLNLMDSLRSSGLADERRDG